VLSMLLLGDSSGRKDELSHYAVRWLRLCMSGSFVHTAFFGGRFEGSWIVRMQDVLAAVREWIPRWEERTEYGGHRGIVGIGAVNGGFAWRVSRTPHRTDLFLDVRVPPTLPMARARAELGDLVRGLRERFPDHGIEREVYVTAPGSEIDELHPLVAAIDEGDAAVFGTPPERDTVRWFSDASALTRYGIECVNY